jgi:pimeloyl-ACP methyl ester carboxylesterase
MPDHLVLLPGMHGTGGLFSAFAAELASDIVPVAVSFPVKAPLGYEELLPIVLASLPKEPGWILGESFSGPLALTAASVCPGKVKGVILCATFIVRPLPRLAFPMARRLLPAWRCLPAGIRTRALVHGRAPGHLKTAVKDVLDSLDSGVIKARLRAMADVDCRSVFAGYRSPMMLLAGTKDGILGTRHLKMMVRMRPDVRAEIFDAPHLLLQHAPARAAKAVGTFIHIHSAGDRNGFQNFTERGE